MYLWVKDLLIGRCYWISAQFHRLDLMYFLTLEFGVVSMQGSISVIGRGPVLLIFFSLDDADCPRWLFYALWIVVPVRY